MLNRPSPLTGILMTLALLGVGAGAIGGAIGDARAQSTTEIEVPAQSLSTAVAALSRQTGLQITAPGELVTGRTTAGVSGAMAPEEALSALLAGTGLSFRMVDANTAVLEPVTAESPSPDDAFLMDQILVRGELQTRTLQETQTSVAVITGAELEGRPDRSLFDVIERTAGTSLGSGGEQVVIRGVPSGGLGGGAPVITTRIDGAVVNFGRFGSNATGSTWDLDQIEILRGPQSTQTGRNTLAGAIEIRSQDPIYDVEMKARAELGNGSTAAGAFVVNTPLIEDKAALRVALDYERTDGFVDNPTLGVEDYDEADQVTLRTGLRLDPTDTFTAILKYTHLNGESSGNGPELQGTLFPDERVNIANVPDREDVTFNAGNVRLFYDIGDQFSLQSETTYSQSTAITTLDIDKSPAPLGVFVNDQKTTAIEQEVKLLYDSDRLRAVVGGFFANDESDWQSTSSFPGFLLVPTLPPDVTVAGILRPNFESTNYAVFGEVEVDVLSDFTMIAGGRYDRQNNVTTSFSDFEVSDPSIASVLPSAGETETDTTFDAFLPKLGLVYDVTENASLGFTVQRGYRAGGAGFNVITAQQNDFDPEFTWNYELSLRSQWFDNRLTVNANAYYTDWNDQQLQVPGDSGIVVDVRTENAGSSRLFGGELELRAQPIDDLEVFASFGYANTEFQDFVLDGEQLAGNEFPFASKYTAAFGGTYYFYRDAFFSADASYQSAAFGDVRNSEAQKLDGRFLVNARLGYEAENWSVTAYVSNLFDNDYVTAVQDAALGREGIINAGPPRTFGVIAQIRF